MATNLTIPSGFIRSVLQNGVGRYINQLQRLTFKFCKHSGGSKAVREFIEEDLVDFAKVNNSIAVYLLPRRNRNATIVAEYLNGHRESLVVNNFAKEEIQKWVELMRCQSGIPTIRYRKYWHTDNPSIQGVWTPFTHKPSELNVASFPHEGRSNFVSLQPSATEIVKELAAKKQA